MKTITSMLQQMPTCIASSFLKYTYTRVHFLPGSVHDEMWLVEMRVQRSFRVKMKEKRTRGHMPVGYTVLGVLVASKMLKC